MATKIAGLEKVKTNATGSITFYSYKGIEIRKSYSNGRKGQVARLKVAAGTTYAYTIFWSQNGVTTTTVQKETSLEKIVKNIESFLAKENVSIDSKYVMVTK